MKLAKILTLSAIALSCAACGDDDDGPGEEIGEEVDEAADDVEDEVED